MFSGIIMHLGTIKKIAKNKSGMGMAILAPKAVIKKLKIGSSINTNGVCLTVTSKNITSKKNEGLIKMFLMNETIRRTAFSSAVAGEKVNLEPSLRLGDEISGHFVFGHVDCVGKILSMQKDGDSVVMTARVPASYAKYFPPKGSVTINGISLTVISRPLIFKKNRRAKKAPKNSVSVALIPHTMKRTNLKFKKPGDLLNIEVDMLARYAKT